MAVRMLGKQKCGLVLVHVMSALVFTAGLLAVISLSVVLVQINSQNQCHLCDDVDKVSRAEIFVLQTTVNDLNRTIKSLMNQLEMVSLEQESRLDSLATNVTMLSSTVASLPLAGNVTAVVSGINVFESCRTVIESNCTVHPSTLPGRTPTPCITEVLLTQPGKFNLDMRCVRAGETLAGENPLVAILNFAQNDFDENIAECQCYVIEDSTNPLTHNVTCGIQVTRCSTRLNQNITAQFVATYN